MLKLSTSEAESKENYEKLQADAERKAEEIEILQKESESNQLRVESLLKEVNQLQSVIEEKELLINQCKENEKKLDQKTKEVCEDVYWLTLYEYYPPFSTHQI